MNTLALLLKRFYAGVIFGDGIFAKIKASFGLFFISFFSPIQLTLTKWSKRYKADFTCGSDAAMWLEVFFNEEYQLPESFRPKRILDLGANVGFASIYFALRDSEATILSIEPDPNNFQVLQKNTSLFPNIQTKQAAVASQTGEREFFSLRNQGMGSSFIRRPSADIIRVPAFSLDKLINESGWQEVDLIKFDVEGAEWEVFEHAMLDRVESLIGEYHEDLTGKPVQEFLKIFPSFKHRIKALGPKRSIIYFYR